MIYPHLGHAVALAFLYFFIIDSSNCIFCSPSNLGFLIFTKLFLWESSSRRTRAQRWKKYQTYSLSKVQETQNYDNTYWNLRSIYTKLWTKQASDWNPNSNINIHINLSSFTGANGDSDLKPQTRRIFTYPSEWPPNRSSYSALS